MNLAGGGYLKIGVTLEFTEEGSAGGHGGSGPDGSKATDLIISTFSQAAPADVTGAREALKEALEEKIIEAYTRRRDGHLLQRVRHPVGAACGGPGHAGFHHGTEHVTHHPSHPPDDRRRPAPPVRVGPGPPMRGT